MRTADQLSQKEVLSRVLAGEAARLAPTGHPSEDQLESFLRAELPVAQAAFIVRHLLTGCPECLEVTRPLWKVMAPRPMIRGGCQ